MRRLAVGLAGLVLAAGVAVAQAPAPADPAERAAQHRAGQERAGQERVAQDRAAEERARREESLRALQDAIRASGASRERLDREIAELRTDRTKLAAALKDAAAGAQATEGRMAAAEERLATLTQSEGGLRRSLDARRGVIGEVLAALLRMGRRPPPAVLVRPEDVLAAVRTSMLLGALVPELRGEAETLAGDLAELVRLKGLIESEREALRRDVAGWARERARLDALVEARQGRLGEAERLAAGERERAGALASEARTLRELVERMEGEEAASRRGADEARRAGEAQAQAARERFAAAALRDPVRLAPKVPFAETRGLLPLPVSGAVLRGFGEAEAGGGTSRGVALGVRPRGVVTAPADGWVAFAGPFRSYGRLLILNAGDGYYLLLAGMDQISVEVGQFVLAGEPVAVMGTGPASSAPGLPATNDPVLYVEFRKDGGSIDPGPWWAKGPSEKVRG